MRLFTLSCVLTLAFLAEATHKCVWVRGILRCNKDPAKHFNVEVRVYDKDGISIFQMIDPDDLMGVTFTEEDGSFQLDGCGDDFNWFPGIDNLPEPYVTIRHYCNSEKGETIELPVFNTFVPETHDIGIMELDAVEPAVVKTTNHGDIVMTDDKSDHVQSSNPKFEVAKKLGQEEDGKSSIDNQTKPMITVTHPDDFLNGH